MEIPYMRGIAECYSTGVLPVEEDKELKSRFVRMYHSIEGGGAA